MSGVVFRYVSYCIACATTHGLKVNMADIDKEKSCRFCGKIANCTCDTISEFTIKELLGKRRRKYARKLHLSGMPARSFGE